jgi:hypothetical protein
VLLQKHRLVADVRSLLNLMAALAPLTGLPTVMTPTSVAILLEHIEAAL